MPWRWQNVCLILLIILRGGAQLWEWSFKIRGSSRSSGMTGLKWSAEFSLFCDCPYRSPSKIWKTVSFIIICPSGLSCICLMRLWINWLFDWDRYNMLNSPKYWHNISVEGSERPITLTDRRLSLLWSLLPSLWSLLLSSSWLPSSWLRCGLSSSPT